MSSACHLAQLREQRGGQFVAAGMRYPRSGTWGRSQENGILEPHHGHGISGHFRWEEGSANWAVMDEEEEWKSTA